MGWLTVLGWRGPGPFWASGSWYCPLFALVYPDGVPASTESHLPLRVCLAADFYLFFQHFLMNSIPKEANFLAGSGGSGSGYGGGWDSVQRFDHRSCRIWVLGAPESFRRRRPISLPFALRAGGTLFWRKSGVGTTLILPPSLCRALGFCRPDFCGLFQLGLLPRVWCLFPSPWLASSPFPRSQTSSWGWDGVFARRMLVGGSIGTLWPPPSSDH